MGEVMKTTTTIRQDHYKKWINTTEVEMTEDNKVLTITTKKNNNGGLSSHASCASYENGWLTHIMYKDFNMPLRSFDTTPTRITRKAVEQQHASIDVESVLEMATSFYSSRRSVA